MSDIAIRVENLSKRYRIGMKEEIHDTFAGAIISFVRNPLKNLKGLRRLSHFEEDGQDSEDVIWALKDVSFEVKRGEVLGIIGRNGAGKSTLLKILSKITYPTTGRVELHGRVSSLLEVGTGFHPELTGRENIYLNGTILGMSKKEIDKKFDEILDFSGVEKFIDTPVKRYSSGMRVRLAFSVAAHLEPEILLVDEVLAVGDAEFQKKCLGKLEDVSGEGRTVVFVSHNMAAVKRLCGIGVYLDNGLIQTMGEIVSVCDEYFQDTIPTIELKDGKKVLVDGPISVEVKVLDVDGKPLKEWFLGNTITIQVFVRTLELVDSSLAVDISANTKSGVRFFTTQSDKVLDEYELERCRDSFALKYLIKNVGINVPELYLDLGVRMAHYRKKNPYLGLFKRVQTIPIAIEANPQDSEVAALVSMPIRLEVLDDRGGYNIGSDSLQSY